MKNKKIFIKQFIIWLFVFQPYNFTHAAYPTNDNLIEFSLALSNSDTHFNFYSNTYKTNLKTWGITWHESFNDYFHAGLELGSTEMSQTDNNITSAQYTSGEYAGLLLRFVPIHTAAFGITFNLNYRHNRTEGESTDQLTEFTWNETLLEGQVHFQPIKYIRIFWAADYQLLSGEQRDTGTITNITSFKESEEHGYRYGINFITNRTGTIGIEQFTGFSSGTRLYFSRKF